jgi:hypothetical protein
MGSSSSTDKHPEGEYFASIIKSSSSSKKMIDLDKESVEINPRAILLKYLSHSKLWDVFLESPFNSFVLTPAELTNFIMDAFTDDVIPDDPSNILPKMTNKQSCVKSYVELVQEMSETDQAKVIDVMAVISSVLLLSKTPIEMKIDQLFLWITLSDQRVGFGFEDFLVALTSFERGLSHALGQQYSLLGI